MGGAERMELDPKKAALEEAEKTFELFIEWTKRVVYISIFCLLVVVIGCNSGVDGTQGGYNGEQYNPSNLNVKGNK
jgi:hypothetical protein|tara:strand:+ start:401 stop:628 length:228 start_codon:yes stop_codon:yes gene_type:complete